jgi:hypothetical protein
MTGDVLFNHTREGVPRPSYVVQDMGYKTPCWIWLGGRNKWGYGKIKRDGRTQATHRLFYRAFVDPDLPNSQAGSDGLDHLCRVRHCINPEHLELVSCAENIRRGYRGKLSLEQVAEIRQRALAGENQHTLARIFGIGQAQISRIKCGLRWSTAPTRAM